MPPITTVAASFSIGILLISALRVLFLPNGRSPSCDCVGLPRWSWGEADRAIALKTSANSLSVAGFHYGRATIRRHLPDDAIE